MNRTISIRVLGKSGAEYGFTFKGDPKYLEGWRAEGFEVTEIINTVPMWVQRMGLTRTWCRAQDMWAWMRLY